MRRRDLVLGPISLVCGSRSIAAEQKTVAILMGSRAEDPQALASLEGFKNKLKELQWFEGRNIRLVIRWAGGRDDLIEKYAAELVDIRPDVICTHSSQLVQALSARSSTIPIIFAGASDPVRSGFAASLTKPGRNISGFTSIQTDDNAKWLELLLEAAQSVKAVGVLYSPNDMSWVDRLSSLETAAKLRNLNTVPVPMSPQVPLQERMARLAEMKAGLIAVPNSLLIANRTSIIKETTVHRIPAIFPWPYFAKEGAFLAYGSDVLGQWPAAAGYVDRVLRGERPADLPIQAASRFRLSINLRVAKEIGIDVPTSLLVRADEVIE